MTDRLDEVRQRWGWGCGWAWKPHPSLWRISRLRHAVSDIFFLLEELEGLERDGKSYRSALRALEKELDRLERDRQDVNEA